jgi:hypothetical protein
MLMLLNDHGGSCDTAICAMSVYMDGCCSAASVAAAAAVIDACARVVRSNNYYSLPMI